jgi:hypothetical protein
LDVSGRRMLQGMVASREIHVDCPRDRLYNFSANKA